MSPRAIGIATQISREFMTASSLQQSFWLVLLVSFVMVGLLTVMKAFDEMSRYLNKMPSEIRKNWVPWLFTLKQTTQGLETIAWTVYGNAMGTFVMLVYLDAQHNMPLILYFVPFYFFLFGFYAINQEKLRSYSLRSQVEDDAPIPTPTAVLTAGPNKLHF